MMMELSPLWAYALEWLNLLLRWTHVVVAVAWIGASFYFVWLDNSLNPPADPALSAKGVGGELWAVHGGGFYNPQKYLGAPPQIPAHLHWFYWESYATWISGFALFTVLYLFNASTFLIDKAVFDWSAHAAVASALGLLAGFWVIYDLICRTLGRGPQGDILAGAAVAGVVVASSYLACHLFAGRAAFLLVGAMMATTMSANVFFWIIPGQRKVIASIQAGRPVDPVHGKRGKQRSVHNTYFTLPVLFAMLSNHYGWATMHAHNWLVLVLIMLSGALIRQFFVARHKTARDGLAAPWHWAAASAGVMFGVAVWLAPGPRLPVSEEQASAPIDTTTGPLVVNDAASGSGDQAASGAAGGNPLFAQVTTIIAQRCAMCHNAQLASKGVDLHTPALIVQHAQQIHQQAVQLRAMPMNNATRITEAERETIGKWFKQGSPGP